MTVEIAWVRRDDDRRPGEFPTHCMAVVVSRPGVTEVPELSDAVASEDGSARLGPGSDMLPS